MRSAPEHPKKDETTVRDIYVFDFDGTITTRDTFALFLRYYSGTWKYICSASIGPYLRWWASSCGVHEQNVMCTELAINADTIAEGLSGYNVWGSNKVRRIFDQFAPQSVKITEAYGDTRGDREMLHAAEASYFKPFRVTPISD